MPVDAVAFIYEHHLLAGEVFDAETRVGILTIGRDVGEEAVCAEHEVAVAAFHHDFIACGLLCYSSHEVVSIVGVEFRED